MTTAVRFQALPPLSPDEYSALEQSIVEHGVMVAVITDEHGVVIDGHHRQKIAAEHNLHCPKRVMRDLTDVEKRTLALSLNLDRRHLTREQRRALVAESIKADPELSDREHGRRTGVSDKTAGVVRDELQERAEIPHVAERSDSLGRKQPAYKPPRAEPPLEHVDADVRLPCTDCERTFEPIEAREPNAYVNGDFYCQDCTPDRGVGPADPTPSASTDQAEPRKRPDPPITKSFFTANYELTKAVGRVVRLSENDRFKKNKDQISGCHLSDLIRARDAINGVIQQLEG